MTLSTPWVGLPAEQRSACDKAQIVLFRKVIRYEQGELPFMITADSRYKLYVNGRFVSFGPAKGDDKVFYYDSFDLSDWLVPGTNTICVMVLHYPTDGTKGNHSLFRAKNAGLWTVGADDGAWRCTVVCNTELYAEEERFAPLQIHEHAAGDPALSGWMRTDYDDSAWAITEPITYDELLSSQQPEKLLPRPVPYAERREHSFTLPSRSFSANGEYRFVLDAGEEMCAFPSLYIKGGGGAQIELLYSECYVTDTGKANRLDSENGHLEGYRDTYTVAGMSDEVYTPFWFRTFRFIEVTIRTADDDLILERFCYEETGYPLEQKTSVRCSDKSLDAVWGISLRTLRRCMHDTYMDCPFYEQLQYIQDTRSEILYTYAISADDRLARQAIDDFRRAQRPDGLLNCSYPNVNVNVIPGFSIYYILMVHDHMMYFGDKRLVERNMPAIERVLAYFESHLTAAGLVDKLGDKIGTAPFWSFIDWAKDWMPTDGMPTAGLYGPITMESLLYLMGLQTAAELKDFIGQRCDALREHAQQLKAVIREHCMDESGMLTDGPGRPEISQQAQVFGILTDTLSAEEGRRNLLRTLSSEEIPQCTVAMAFYLFRALEKTGLYEYTDRFWNLWRKMIANGCTTCTEGGDYNRSECHAWGALALYELPSVTLGVRPAAPGYEKIAVRPVPGYMTNAAGMVCTPRGDISVAWVKEGDGIRLTVDCTKEIKNRIV